MWENHKTLNLIIRILLILLALALAASLFLAIRYVSRVAAEQEQSFQAVSSQKQEEQNAVKVENLEQVEADYRKDMDTVARYLPGIVCWGDDITGGSVSGVSYPSILQDLINENICSVYDFRSTLDYADNISRVNWSDYTVEIPVVNMGTGKETTDTILGRNGAVPFVVNKAFDIPADTRSVQISFTSENGDAVAPLLVSDGGVNQVLIGDVVGTISLGEESYSGRQTVYYFTRAEEGDEVKVEAGTLIYTAASSQYGDYITVINIGTYGGNRDVDELISQIKAILDHQISNNDRYIVVGLYSIGAIRGNGVTENFAQYENAMQKAFGDHFVNIRKYLITDAMDDAKLKPTANDNRQIMKGLVPDSLRSAAGAVELSSTAYKLIGQLIYDQMDRLGYFAEVKEELGIE